MGEGGVQGFWNYAWAVQYFLDILVRGAILPGTFCVARNTSWIFVSLARYNQPPAPRSLTVARFVGAPFGRSPHGSLRSRCPPAHPEIGNAKALASSAYTER